MRTLILLLAAVIPSLVAGACTAPLVDVVGEGDAADTCYGCVAGYVANGSGGCTQCTDGTNYSSAVTRTKDAGGVNVGAGTCTTCTATGTGQTSSTACTTTTDTVLRCNAGYSSAGTNLANACTVCSAGTFRTATTLASAASTCATCTNPGTGQTSSTACTTTADTILKCDAGYSSSGSNAVDSCTACTTGTFRTATTLASQTSTCDTCTATGTGQTSSTACTTTTNTVLRCDTGFRSTGTNLATSCIACTTGTFIASTTLANAVSTCATCTPAGTGERVKTECSATANDRVFDCDTNYRATGAGATGTCVACAAGHTRPAGDLKLDTVARTCDVCAINYRGDGTNCVACASGYYIAAGGLRTTVVAACTNYQCGDAKKVTEEACDDGNIVASDGCGATCLIETGWTSTPGVTAGAVVGTDTTSSVMKPIYGDYKQVGWETCDDGNQVNGDGCSATSQAERGYACTGGTVASASTCKTVCGDSYKIGTEQCDDGNTFSGDGCDASCNIEIDVCDANWQGADCSERTCNYHLAFVDSPTGTETAHWYAECSNKGICNRQTGECECFPGYTGKGCRRTTCPNKCSGHGTCYYIEQLTAAGDRGNVQVQYDEVSSLPNKGITYNLWDKKKTQGCVCDPYYEGADCSLRMCPRGDNILTLKKTVDQIQRVCFVDNDGTANANPSGEVTMVFTDLFGGKWETRKIIIAATDDTTNIGNIKAALKALPNSVIPDVSVAATDPANDVTTNGGSAGHGKCYAITFNHEANSGAQNLLTVNYKGCKRAGCAPLYNGISSGNYNGVRATVADVTTFSTTNTEYGEKSVCSEHGLCDSSTGLCKCFSGYYNLDCSYQHIEA